MVFADVDAHHQIRFKALHTGYGLEYLDNCMVIIHSMVVMIRWM